MSEAKRRAEITAVYDALHKDKLGAHWLWCVIEKIADGQSEENAMREYGYYARAAVEAAQPEAVARMRDALESIQRHCEAQPSALAKAIVATCDSGLAAAPTPTESQPAEAQPDYSGMSREALERHARRMAQVLNDDCARLFYAKHADGPMMPPSCLCCGQLPEEVAVKHMELPGIVVCAKCRDAALSAPTAPAQAEPVAWTLTETLERRQTTTTGYLWFTNPQNSGWTPLYATPPATAAGPSDAERYRWLRSNWFTMGAWYPDGKVKFTTGETRWSDQPESNIDKAIDAAIRATKGGEL